MELKEGSIVLLKRKPTNENCSSMVFRTIRSIDYNKKKILCDDNIGYKFGDVYEKSQHEKLMNIAKEIKALNIPPYKEKR